MEEQDADLLEHVFQCRWLRKVESIMHLLGLGIGFRGGSELGSGILTETAVLSCPLTHNCARKV